MNSAYYSLHNKVSVKMTADKKISAHIDYTLDVQLSCALIFQKKRNLSVRVMKSAT